MPELRAGSSAALGLCMEQLESAPSAHPSKVSGVGAGPGFQLWAPSPLIWVCATGLQVRAGCFSHVHSPGAEGGGAPEALAAVEGSLTIR